MAKLKWYQSWEMRSGGNQLAELISKDFPLAYLRKHKKELELTNHDLNILKTWIDCGFSIRKALMLLEQEHGRVFIRTAITRFFIRHQSLFQKLIKMIDINAQFDEEGRLLHRYSFLQYDEFYVEDSVYRVVEIPLNKQRYWHDFPSDFEIRKYNKLAVYRMYKGRWNKTQTKYAREYLMAYRQMKLLM